MSKYGGNAYHDQEKTVETTEKVVSRCVAAAVLVALCLIPLAVVRRRFH